MSANTIEVTPEVKAELEGFGASKAHPVPTNQRKRMSDSRRKAIQLLLENAEAGTSVEIPKQEVVTWANFARKANRKVTSSRKGAAEGKALVFIL